MLNERSQTIESANVIDNHYELLLGVLQLDRIDIWWIVTS